ncbi:histidine kinase [Phanerochaete sordida]|uniref:histidine kinase n=1 Tax=Phanerochaete sordida TaxID=48140 RepID=A0A9P3G405_9APHY|nr:histidine kinase [Phanerochaete sordida]
MRRKYAQPALPNLFFRDGVLSVPGYTFEKAVPWEDTGSMTHLAEGLSLKDGSSVLAKIAFAHSNASMCIEREAHILERMAGSVDSSNVALRMIDFFNIPKANGDCVVLLLVHPGLNLLGRYFPPLKVNDLLLADVSRARPSTSHGDVYMMGVDEADAIEDMEPMEVMDLASFLEFAIQATRALELIHRFGIIHREVRANAFHLNAHSGLVRLVHFGNRAVSLEQFGVPSAFVLRSDMFEEAKKLKVKEALCYLAPEQTGGMESTTEDQRTDLYSLGVLFWTLLVGRGTLPFEGGPLELLHAIVQKRPMPVHEVRRDVPQVLALIIDKLLAKAPDARYHSAYGLKADLLQCQRLLLNSVTLATEQVSTELIPFFEIGLQDRYTEFTIPSPLFGREKELETIRNVIRNASTSYSRHLGTSTNSVIISSASHTTAADDRSSSSSSKSENVVSVVGSMPAPTPVYLPPNFASRSNEMGNGSRGSPSADSQDSDGLRRAALGPSSRRARTHAVIVVGPPGAGKSSLILAHQAKWRSHGLWGQCKFQESEAAPFASLLSCLSSVLRQLIVFHTDLHRFVTSLRARLGPQLHNVPLLYQGVPELKDILALFDISLDTPQEVLETHELRARFESLVESVFSVLAETRLFALFLDDLQDASTSSLDLIRALINSRSRMLIFATVRVDTPEVLERLKPMFNSRSSTWIHLEPLNFSAVSSLVSRTLRRSKEDCQPLSRIAHAASLGNPFSVRNMLATLQRQHFIVYNWDKNYWDYDIDRIEKSLAQKKTEVNPNDLSFLIAQLRELDEDAKKYLVWASFFGSTFKVTEVAFMMDWDDSGSSSDDDTDGLSNVTRAVSQMGPNDASPSTTRGSMRGLQLAIHEGWLVQRARDMCSFAHDRYRQAAQAEAQALPEGSIAKMSFRIIMMMMHEPIPDIYRIAEHAKQCLPLLRDHPRRDELLDLSIDAGDSARARGAHELALQAFLNAISLLDDDPWRSHPERTMSLYLKLAELSTWKGDYASSDFYIAECMSRTGEPENKAQILRIRSRNYFMRGNYTGALRDTIHGLHLLGVDVNATPSRREADQMFEDVKNEILAVGFEEILAIPRARDARTDLAISLLNDAGANAYWSAGEGFADIIGLTTIRLALRAGMCPGTALGFFWALAAAAERRELYRFSADLGKLALRLADQYGSSHEKCRALLLFAPLVSGYDSAHYRTNIPRLEQALKFGQSAGDRLYCSFSSLHLVQCRLFICEHLTELVTAAEESLNDVTLWSQNSDLIVFCQAHLNIVRAYAGQTIASSSDTIFDTDEFSEKEFLAISEAQSGNYVLAMNWYNSFKVAALFCLGFHEAAAEHGFFVFETRDKHPNHRHSRYALFFHSLALISCIRKGELSPEQYARYMRQIDANQNYIRKWLSPSPVNNSTWVALVDAEMASLLNSPDAFKLYDVAVKLAVNNDWLLEEGWALFLQGSHFVRCGVEGLGGELQRRGMSRQSQWGARGIASYMASLLDDRVQLAFKRHIFSADAAVQTDNVMISASPPSVTDSEDELFPATAKTSPTDEDVINKLTAADLASILKWSREISRDINLSLALQRLTEIVTENSGSQSTCVVIAREAGDYTVATSMIPPESCQVHENPIPVRAIPDPLQRAVIQHALNTKARMFLEDVSAEPRFSSEARESLHRSIICLPIFSNRGQTFGAVYLASKYTFSPNTVTVLSLLCEQASVGIANALLFRSVQAGTRENLKMIAIQKEALEAARKSREDALKATKIKSNFLASMSHELRTPFSSFYGLLDILSGTELNSGQREIVTTAKQSCELLLKIIDSILDYSKLEASALKLEFSPFPVENIIADCMELLLPMAAKKLDLSFDIEPDVPPWVTADYARIRQVLMNLIGNAVKFTASGFVRVTCGVDRNSMPAAGEVNLKFVIQDTGIGLSPSDVDLLFVPFQQADNSSTRRFGGTGLGLSISRQLVKLMGGAIGVQSELGVGSMFWFTIPVKICDSQESREALADISRLKAQLMVPQPLRVLVASQSPATHSLLSTMLGGFYVSSVSSVDEAHAFFLEASNIRSPLDFIILDEQSERRADELCRYLHQFPGDPFRDTKIVHLYTPTTDALTGHTIFSSDIPGVVRMTKPPRTARLLQTLGTLKNPGQKQIITTGASGQAEEQQALEARTLYGNVLIAEDNPVAQKLLIKQLEKFDFNVVATSNGEEAIAEWESRGPGYFSVALFDHHMPICDGVEACKRIRILENKRRVPVSLPIVALSADCQESTKQLCLSAGMNNFRSKPLKRSDLIQLLTMFGTPPSAPQGPIPPTAS